jgi:ribosomal-protein-alanine N-acetyltransferase
LEQVSAIQAASPQAAQWEAEHYLSHGFLVAASANRVVGFIVYRETSDRESEILNLAVHPQFRQRGVGRRLIMHALKERPGDFFLEVRNSNVAAQAFYRALGFQQTGKRPEYYEKPPESAIVMKIHSW